MSSVLSRFLLSAAAQVMLVFLAFLQSRWEVTVLSSSLFCFSSIFVKAEVRSDISAIADEGGVVKLVRLTTVRRP